MRSLLSRRENLALALSAVALFAAAGGPSWAAGQINGKRLKPASVTNAKLAKNAVTSVKVRPGTLLSSDLRDGTVQRRDVAPDFFTGLQTALGTGSIYSALIADGAVTTEKIPNQAVTGVKINAGAVSTSRLLNNAVTSGKIEDATITGADIAKNGVTGANLDGTGTATLDLPLLADGTCSAQPVTVTGADLTDDVVLVTPPATLVAPVSIYATVQSATQFSVNVCAVGAAGTDLDDADGAYRWVAING